MLKMINFCLHFITQKYFACTFYKNKNYNSESINVNNSTAVNNSFMTVNLSNFRQYRTCHKLCKQLNKNGTKMCTNKNGWKNYTTSKQPIKKKGTGRVYERHCTAYYRIMFKTSLQLTSSSAY